MEVDFDYDLTPDQWETLKALRLPADARRNLSKPILDQLATLELADVSGDQALITAMGRHVLLRGSPRLLDVAA